MAGGHTNTHTRYMSTSFRWGDEQENEHEDRFFALREKQVDEWDGVVTEMLFDVSVKGVSIAVANAIRKSVMSMVVSVAIDPDSVAISKNESNTHNEQLVHRLSLLPLHVDDPSALVKTSVSMKLSVRNDHVSVPRLVTSKYIQCYWTDPLPGKNDDDTRIKGIVRANPVTGKFMPILVLEPGEGVDLTCGVTTTCASKGGAAFQNFLCSYGLKELDENMISMRVEGYICRDVGDAVVDAMYALRNTCHAMFDDARIRHHEEDDHMFLIDMGVKADIVTCNLLQSFIINDSIDNDLCFVGVHKPHPLQDGIRFVVAVRQGTTVSCEDVRSIMTKHASLLSTFINELAQEFTRFVRRSRLAKRKTPHTQ